MTNKTEHILRGSTTNPFSIYTKVIPGYVFVC